MRCMKCRFVYAIRVLRGRIEEKTVSSPLPTVVTAVFLEAHYKTISRRNKDLTRNNEK